MSCCARFLVLLDDTPRALLLDMDQQLLGEVIEDDGFIVESLLRNAEQCPLPGESVLRGVTAPPARQQPMRCFALR